jgi:hypothetical protein
MRFRAGLVIGFAAGYYLGTAAGRERHEEINRAIQKLQRYEAVQTVTDKTEAVVALGVERVKDVVDGRLKGNGNENGNGNGTADVPAGGATFT